MKTNTDDSMKPTGKTYRSVQAMMRDLKVPIAIQKKVAAYARADARAKRALKGKK